MKTIFAIALTLTATVAVAQKSAPAEVKVASINDRRSSGSFSRLSIELELPKLRSSEMSASRVLVSAATDDTGRSLIDPEAAEPQLDENVRNMRKADPSEPPAIASVSLTLLNPDRKAKTVKEVRGEIELFLPGQDPNSTAEFAKFVSTAGKPLSHKALKANGVELALLTDAQIDAERKRIAGVKRKELKDIGYEDGEALDEMVRSQTESLLAVEASDLLVRLKDPNQRIHELAYIDAAGEVKRISTRTEEGLVYFSTWGEKPQPDWKLRVTMKTAKNLVRYPFSLRDVPLP